MNCRAVASLAVTAGLMLSLCCLTPLQAKGDNTKANKQLVLDFFRVVFEAENVDAADQYLAPGYIQHNPLVATGRDGFVKYFKSKWKAPKPVRATLEDAPVEVMAEGDLVTLMWKVQKKDPQDNSKTYDAFWFDMFRVKDGKLVEHWDCATKK
jgi:predicted SnoaL-like aldol condensation-catalyzing enzyme